MKALEVIKIGSSVLKENNISSHILDSELLLSRILNKSREEILTNLNQKIDQKKFLKFKEFLKRRSKNEPLAYIFKEKEFWSKKFLLNKETLIPRPETELLVDILARVFKNKKITILDIGTGSGCIIISLLSCLRYSTGIGVDTSRNSISIAKKNSSVHEVSNRVKFFNKSFESIFSKKFDLIVSNPPYIESKEIKNLQEDIKRYEPRMALDGGNDGLDLIKKLSTNPEYLEEKNGTPP